MERLVERLRGREVATERFLHDHARVGGHAEAREAGGDRAKQARGDRKVEQRPRRRAERVAQRGERGGIRIVARDVRQAGGQASKGVGVHAAMRLNAVSGTRTHLLDRPLRLRDADDRDVEKSAARHRLQRRKDLLVGEIACRAE